ncbi:hypothetical protein SDC9_58939 [bioreactor metagenome]|uniref:Uncharacterized protein n=1 Tax=bioreactor metagenome TaxID=1076179 RepID=A0A644X8S8_9ZZZZ
MDGVDQAHFLGFLRLNHLAGEDQFLGSCRADAARQTLGAGKARSNAQAHLGLAEFCLFRGQNDVAGHGQLAAAAQSKTVYRGNGGNLQQLDSAKQGGTPAAPGPASGQIQGALLGNVGSGHKGAALSRNNERPQRFVVLYLVHQR